MDSSTGCISIGTVRASGVEIDRVVEYCSPSANSCCIWVDIFCSNTSKSPRRLLVLHRGSFVARDVTRLSWIQGGDDDFAFESMLTRRLKRLHKNFDPVVSAEANIVRVGNYEYRVPDSNYRISTVVGGDEDADAAFTMWEISEIPAHTRQVIRLALTMGKQTFQARISGRESFHAYGEAILLQKIEFEDLASFDGRDREEYREAFARFMSGEHIVPDVFEYLLVSEGEFLDWDVTPLSPGLSARWITYPDLNTNTVWFVMDILNATFSIVGRRKYNAFALRITADPKNISGHLPLSPPARPN
jgi:hypothetical protein